MSLDRLEEPLRSQPRSAPSGSSGETVRRSWVHRAQRPRRGVQFKQPGGGELAMGSLLGNPLVLNFWASWCVPCMREMPELDAFHRTFGA